MSGSKLDQIVKGAPTPDSSTPAVVSRSTSPAPPLGIPRSGTRLPLSDPLSTLPSSPPQIYLNLLILEASLRSQYLTLRARRRQHTFFLLVLTIWIACFFYALFLRPREDGSGVGGSVYWVVEIAEKVALMGGVLTGILMWGTGQWDRGVRWPRRWVGVANRGLRNVNAKIVVIKGSWWREILGLMYFLFPLATFSHARESFDPYMDLMDEKSGEANNRSKFETIQNEPTANEDLSPGGDYIKLLLMPKPFSADFRENWELYRIEYWEKENGRRARARKQLKAKERECTKEQGGWRSWLGWRNRDSKINSSWRGGENEKSRAKHNSERNLKGRSSFTRSKSQLQNISRSITPTDVEPEEHPSSGRVRRGSSNASGSERRRKVRSSASSDNVTGLKFLQLNSF